MLCVCGCLDKCSWSALKGSFPSTVFYKPSVVAGQFWGSSPFLFLLSSNWAFLCCGQCNSFALLYLSCPICCHPNQKQGVWHISETAFFSKTTFQGHNSTECHSREPGCVSKPICFMCCFLFFSHSPLFCLLSLNWGDSQCQIRTFLPGEMKEGLLEAWLSLFQLQKENNKSNFPTSAGASTDVHAL